MYMYMYNVYCNGIRKSSNLLFCPSLGSAVHLSRIIQKLGRENRVE